MLTLPSQHPISRVRWVYPETLRANAYNPNHVFPAEKALLKQSLIEKGWTAAILVVPDEDPSGEAAPGGEIIDGFHRWSLGSSDPEVRALSAGLVPVVYWQPPDLASQQAATVQLNRARGSHGIVAMGELVRSMREQGLGDEEIRTRMGMEQEEIDRLAELRPSTEQVGRESFGRGWVPTPTR